MVVELTEAKGSVEKSAESDDSKPVMTVEIVPASFLEQFSEAKGFDYLYMLIGTIAAFLEGASIPLFNFLFGTMLDDINGDPASFDKAIKDTAISFAVVGAIAVVIGTIQIYCWTVAGERQAQRFRKKYVDAILRYSSCTYANRS